MIRRLFLLTAVVILSSTSLQAEPAQSVTWQNDLAEAAREARGNNTPIVVFVESDACHFCVKMKRQTLAAPKIDAALRHFTTVRINAAEQRQLAKNLGVRAFPTTIIAAPDGAVLKIAEGFLTAEEFHAELVAAHQKWRHAGESIARTP